jgi:hypothetical protein
MQPPAFNGGALFNCVGAMHYKKERVASVISLKINLLVGCRQVVFAVIMILAPGPTASRLIGHMEPFGNIRNKWLSLTRITALVFMEK